MLDSNALVDLAATALALSGDYENVVVARLNDHVVRMSRMTAAFAWHYHPNSDELFIGFRGVVILEVERERIELRPGMLFTVPKGVVHRTAPADAVSINLTVERADMDTVAVAGPNPI